MSCVASCWYCLVFKARSPSRPTLPNVLPAAQLAIPRSLAASAGVEGLGHLDDLVDRLLPGLEEDRAVHEHGVHADVGSQHDLLLSDGLVLVGAKVSSHGLDDRIGEPLARPTGRDEIHCGEIIDVRTCGRSPHPARHR